MANKKHLEILNQGVMQWNRWRLEHETIRPNLKGANLERAVLTGVDLNKADLRGATLKYARLEEADMVGADLSGADLSDAFLFNLHASGANLSKVHTFGANMTGADLSGANLRGALMYDTDLEGADLTGADLTGADLSCADLVETNFTKATITGCRVYGVSAWNVTLVDAVQQDLIISNEGEPELTVDDLEVAQFIYLMVNNAKIRNVINTISSKGVLILGRFSDPERKSVLDGLKEKLREFDLLPIVFDFDRPTDKDYTETVQTLAGMCMFVIADLTNPKSTPLELEATVKQFKIPYVPIIDKSVDPNPFAMLVDLQKSFHWVLPTLRYQSKEQLLGGAYLKKHIVDRAKAKREELWKAKNQEPEFYEPE
jgi:pentapeptide repeat protein